MSPSRGLRLTRRPLTGLHTSSRPRLLPRQFDPQLHRTSPSRSFSLTESAITTTHTLLTTLHTSTSLPWYLTLPLAAFTVRLTLVLPLTLLSQRNRAQRAAILPQVLAARPELERQVMSKYGHLGPETATRHLSRALVAKRKELTKEAGISSWQGWAQWGQFPIWLLFIETLRRMAGQERGLLGLVTGLEGTTLGATASRNAANANANANANAHANASGPTPAGISTTVEVTDPSTSTLALTEPINYHPMFEPSLSTGGALWFPDLLIPDPQLILPFALSGILFTNIYREEKLVEAAGIKPPRWSRGLTRGLKIVALMIGPATLNMPAAMHVYWLASATTALAQKKVADWVYPVPRMHVPTEESLGRALRPPPPVVGDEGIPKRPYRPIRKKKRY